MKATQKRVWSILLALMMLVSILGSVIVLPVQAATVDYVYSDVGNYIYNWGQREELATFLSPNAVKFYSDNRVTYDELSALSGTSSNSGAKGCALYTELNELMESNHSYKTSYDGTKELYRYTDCQNSGGSISSFYSGVSIGPGWGEGGSWNREHTWPNSKGDDAGSGEKDIMMLRPTSSSENSSRGNKAYGNTTSTSYYNPNDEGGGKYDLRGDVARIMLYQHVRWGAASLFGADGVIESKDVMLDWIAEDPVDTWEMGRNDSVESITGTRNVFVDYPELAFLLFNEDIPDNYDSPSGEGAGPVYTVSASTNNSTYGTVSLSGKTITATPKTGYAVSGYTILSGNATVTRNGNVFTVAPTSDVSIRINFAPKTSTTVQFVGLNGITTQTAYVGDDIALPAHSGAVPEGYTFLGWSEQNVEETEIAPTYHKAGSSYTVSAGAILYALYSRFDSEGSGNVNSFEPYSGTLTEGDYLVVYEGGALKAEINSGTRFNYTDIAVENGQIQNDDAFLIWHIAPNGNYWTIYNESVGQYAGGTTTNNKGALLASITDYAQWTVSGTSTYEFVNGGNNRYLRRNGTYGYACYSTSTGGALTLYKRQSGTLYYFTATACEHTYTSKVTTAATCVEDGVLIYTCSACGDSYTEAIPATGNHTYGDDFDTDCDVCGATRALDFAIYSDVVEKSAMEMTGGTGGLAFKFDASASGVEKNTDNSVVWDDAKVVINGEEYQVAAMGAVMTNDETVGNDPEQMTIEHTAPNSQVLNIPVEYLYAVEEENCTFAIRIINIPTANFDTVIYARPYYIIERNGEQIVLYEDIVTGTYNGL
ncbi:MAG: endonuclease [Clostridia bacterium]|nr:endonuclease [Clostridia bacterium]